MEVIDMKITPKDWSKHQHYKDRSPPWIKLHTDLLDDFIFQRLPIASKALAPMLWLLASRSTNAEIYADPEVLAFKLRMTEEEIIEGLKPLIECGLFIDASGVLADRLRNAIPETETERETERETNGEIEEKPTKTPSASSKKGSRLPDDWLLPKAWGEWALSERKDWTAEEVRRCAERFADFWHAKPGREACKLDWLATWRNWVRNDRDKRSSVTQRPQTTAELRTVAATTRLTDFMNDDGTMKTETYRRMDDDRTISANTPRLVG